MIRKDEGVVLRTARSGETSRLVSFLGRESGKIRLLAKGALRETSPFRGVLEPGSHAEVLYYFKHDRSIYYLREAHAYSSLETGRDSLVRMVAGLAALELLDAVCYPESPEPRIVDLAVDYLAHPEAVDPLFFFLAFEMKLLAVLGAIPDFTRCAACGSDIVRGCFHPEDGEARCSRHGDASRRRIELDGELIATLRALENETLSEAARRSADRALRKRLGGVIHWTYTLHVQNYRLPESLKLLPKE
jgi:DNA repair protein RecO (recombination protein O)